MKEEYENFLCSYKDKSCPSIVLAYMDGYEEGIKDFVNWYYSNEFVDFDWTKNAIELYHKSKINDWIPNEDMKPARYKWCIVKDKDGKEYKDHQWNGMSWYDYVIDEECCSGWRSYVEVEYWKYDEERLDE